MPKILAVDDDLYILEMYRDIFAKTGFEIETAEDAATAISKYQSFQPDLLILDVEMPAGGGEKVFDRLRNLFMVTIPIIFATGMPELVETQAKADSVEVLKKPINAEILVRTAKKMLKME